MMTCLGNQLQSHVHHSFPGRTFLDAGIQSCQYVLQRLHKLYSLVGDGLDESRYWLVEQSQSDCLYIETLQDCTFVRVGLAAISAHRYQKWNGGDCVTVELGY